MKKTNLLIMMIIFMALTALFIFLRETTFTYISSTLTFVILIMLSAKTIIDKQYQKKLDKRYMLLTNENMIKQYDKLRLEKENDKIMAFCLIYFKLLENYDDKTILNFGKYLKTKFSIDPIGFNDGVVVIVVNMHEIMMNEMFKTIKNELKQLEFNIKYKVGMAYFSGNETYDALLEEAKKGVK